MAHAGNHTIKSVMFDMGNVLLFFNARISAKAFARATGLSEEEIWQLFFISEFEKKYTRGEVTTQEFYEEANKSFPKKLDLKTFGKLWNDIFTENLEIEDILKKLKKHYPLYLISNTNDLHFEYVKKKFGLMNHFTKFFPSHLVGHRKPSHAMFHHVLKDIQLKPEETVFVDDILEFVEGAREVGIHGVQFTTCKELEKDLRKLGVQI